MNKALETIQWSPEAGYLVIIDVFYNQVEGQYFVNSPSTSYVVGTGDTKEQAIEHFKTAWLAGKKLHEGIKSGDIYDKYDLIEDALEEYNKAVEKFPDHPNVSFTCCRIAEEVGELIQAATSSSHGRDKNRRDAMRLEARQAIAMILRLMEQWPDGMVNREDG